MKSSTIALAVLVMMGCSDPVAPDPAAFGALYRIQSAPDPPILTGQSLEVTLEYGGCRTSHEFELRSRVTSPTSTDLWPVASCQLPVRYSRQTAPVGASSASASRGPQLPAG